MQEGRTVVFGGFRTIPPFGLPGWICQVRSRHGRIWLLALMVDEISHSYKCNRIEEIPWEHWVGNPDHKGEWNGYCGDDPRSNGDLWRARVAGL